MSNTGGKGRQYYPMILVDKSTGSRQLIEILSEVAHKTPKTIVAGRNFDSGDVKWTAHGKTFMVEYKKLDDVLKCISDGRFVSQLRRMHEQADYYWLLIGTEFKATDEGKLKFKKRWGKFTSGSWFEPFTNGRDPVTYYGLVGWLTTMELLGGCMLWTVQGDEQAAHWIYAKYLWSLKEKDKHKSLNVFDTSQGPKGKDSRGVKFIGKPNDIACVANALCKSLKGGIGWEKARALGRHFTSVETFMTASKSELMKVKGIGKELAERIVSCRSRVINRGDADTGAKTSKKGRVS